MILPLRDRILVKRIATKDTTESGLIIPENAKEKANVGIVVAVGPGRRVLDLELTTAVEVHYGRDKTRVCTNETVLFGKYSGHEFEHEGETLLFLREDEILAVLEEGEQE